MLLAGNTGAWTTKLGYNYAYKLNGEGKKWWSGQSLIRKTKHFDLCVLLIYRFSKCRGSFVVTKNDFFLRFFIFVKYL